MEILKVAAIGLFVGVLGTGLGGLLIALFRSQLQNEASFSTILGFSAGIMLSISIYSLLPEAFDTAPPVWGLAGLILGSLLIGLADRLIPHKHVAGANCQNARFYRASILVGIGIAIHNLPEGMAIGASFTSSQNFGLTIAILMALQNLPEGMAMACPLSKTDLCGRRIVFLTMLAGLPMGIGALLGVYIGQASPLALATSLGFAAGAMLFITFDELIPDAQRMQKGYSGTIGAVVGVILGIILGQFH